MAPKHLRKLSDGQILAWTPELAKRSEFVAHYEDGEEPEHDASTGLDIRNMNKQEVADTLKEELRNATDRLLATEKEMNKLVIENQELNDRVAELEGREKPPEQPPPVVDNLSAKEREKLLVAKTVEMIKNADPVDFTGSGRPRVERLEAFSGIAEITAEERDTAFELATLALS
jgi:hypothetical protein